MKCKIPVLVVANEIEDVRGGGALRADSRLDEPVVDEHGGSCKLLGLYQLLLSEPFEVESGLSECREPQLPSRWK